VAHEIYRDDRADHEAKELLLALTYACTTPREDGASVWTIARTCLGRGRRGRWRLAELLAKDAPRYHFSLRAPRWEGHEEDELWHRCCAPRLRPYREPAPSQAMFNLEIPEEPRPEPEEDFRNRLGVCGADASEYVIEKLPDTGWHKAHWFCTRHESERRRTERQLIEPNRLAPAPIPNRGGLLPCYFDAEWLTVYRLYCGEQWKPPVYGMRADGWPIPGKEPVPMRARLRLAALDGEILAQNT